MKDHTRDFWVGLTTLSGVVGLLALLTLIGGVTHFYETGYHVTINMPAAGGLHAESRVIYNGIDIGRIDSVALRPPPQVGVVAVAMITEPGVELPDDVMVVARFPSMLGGSAVADLSRKPGPVSAMLATDGSAVIEGEPAADFTQIAEQVAELAESFDTLSREWTLVGENINQLVEPRQIQTVDAGDIAGNLATIMARADTRLAELELAIDGFNQYVNDPELRDDVRATAANARQVSQRFNDSVESLRDKYVAVADDLSAAVQTMKSLAEKTLSGGGTFGKMINDPALYENLNDASERLNAAIDEARLLVEKWKAEGLPVQF
jgi:phospholipid/cholesterol/gamma-HCH transport system substrate-binding protein